MATYRVGLSVELEGEYEVEADSREQALELVQAMIDSGDYDDTDSKHWTSPGAQIDWVLEK